MKTRRKHLAELTRVLGYQAFSQAASRAIVAVARSALDQLLQRRPGTPFTFLAWLRAAPQSSAARNLLALIECIQHVRTLVIDRCCQAVVPLAVFERLADEGLRMTTQHLGELALDRRHAVLAATVMRLEGQIIDATLGIFETLMGSLARKAERRTEEKTLRSARDLRAHLDRFEETARGAIALKAEGVAAVFDNLRRDGQPLGTEIMKHVAPLGWEHIILTGDYIWNERSRPANGQLRPLRLPPSLLAV